MARVGGALQSSFFFQSVPPFGILIGSINYNYNMRPFRVGGKPEWNSISGAMKWTRADIFWKVLNG